MNNIIDLPLCLIIACVVSVLANLILAFFLWLSSKENRRLRELAGELQHQTEKFTGITHQLLDIVHEEQRRCVRILDRVLTQREKEEEKVTSATREAEMTEE